MINLNKTIYFIVLFILVSLNAQLTKIEIDIKGNFTATVESNDASIELNYMGKIIDIDATGQITYDFSGRILNIGSTQIAYDLSGKVSSIGSTQIAYDLSGKVSNIGSTQIAYDFSGRVISIGLTQITYDLGRVTSIGSMQITYDWPGRVISCGNYKSTEGIVFKFKIFQ